MKLLIARLIENFGIGYLVNSLYSISNNGISQINLINLAVAIFLLTIAIIFEIRRNNGNTK